MKIDKRRLWVSVLAEWKVLPGQDDLYVIGAINNEDERIGYITKVQTKIEAGNWVSTSRMEGIWQIEEILEISFLPDFPGRITSFKAKQNTSLEIVLLLTLNLNIKDLFKSGIFKA